MKSTQFFNQLNFFPHIGRKDRLKAFYTKNWYAQLAMRSPTQSHTPQTRES